jgi:hypothetical protein
MQLPSIPAPMEHYLAETAQCKTQADIRDATKPYIEYESKLREVFAQYPDHAAASREHLLPLFNAGKPTPVVRARDPTNETEEIRDRYLLALPNDERLANGVPAIVSDLNAFKTNFK